MRKDVLIINYNTTELTRAAIQSLNKTTEGCHIYVFDNSDKEPFSTHFSNVTIIDNTKGQIINFDQLLSMFPDKVENRSNWGSTRHCSSVDKCFDLLPNGFVLMDSDVLVKKDITPLYDNRYAWVGDVNTNTRRFCVEIPRVVPYLCYINVPILLERGIRYFNADKMWFLNKVIPNMYYDTGAWLYEESMRNFLYGRKIDVEEYAVHFRHGSWKEKDGEMWLNEHQALWK